jgi:hypothetical protein
MKTRKEAESKINILPDSDKESLRILVEKLTSLQEDGHITEKSMSELENICFELLGMKDRHHKYLIRWIRQDYLVD